ncbi:MAG: signal peptidase II [Candidatus Melainabacteria bacterium RIFCSPHIGHO2_02_FULL_34_12]|nr:MAG: signal peptidase II [Candidatus Melainabacteria bacterium RIFCSPHIGHO2_02_FULL_34_12]
MTFIKNIKQKPFFDLILVILIIVFDQITKYLLMKDVGLNNTKAFLPGIVEFTLVTNTGGAFSLFKEFPWFFKLIGIINILIFSYLTFCPTVKFKNLMKTGFACILGGTMGNLIDRFFRGGVIDFINLQFMNFAIFNVADISIDIGVGLLFIGWFLRDKK